MSYNTCNTCNSCNSNSCSCMHKVHQSRPQSTYVPNLNQEALYIEQKIAAGIQDFCNSLSFQLSEDNTKILMLGCGTMPKEIPLKQTCFRITSVGQTV